MRRRAVSSTAFLDLLFNFLLAFVMMFIILMMIIKVETHRPAVEDKNEFIIVLTWTEGVDNDVDLWVRGPTGVIIGFTRKEADGMFLQRDDLGLANDWVMSVDGEQVFIPLNQEIINIRKIVPGTYTVNSHFYRRRGGEPTPESVEVKLIKINPYREVATARAQLQLAEEATHIIFEVDAKGEVTVHPTVPSPFVVLRHFNSGTSLP